MERLKNLANRLRQEKNANNEEVLNLAREYIQVLVLKIIFQSKFGRALSFMGGTCLRICYDLKRYSEDLDLCLDDANEPYHFKALIALINKELSLKNFVTTTNIHSDKTVQKAFIRISDLDSQLNLKQFHQSQKLHIKIEVDTHPIPIKPSERESFYVSRFQEIFPILKHTLPTLFAGKVLAILHRPYARGRDYYDLVWYLSQKIPLNLDYLNKGLKGAPFETTGQVFTKLQKIIKEVQPEIILKDIGRFLEDPTEVEWLRDYSQLFNQLLKKI